jgi:hypothetical protein
MLLFLHHIIIKLMSKMWNIRQNFSNCFLIGNYLFFLWWFTIIRVILDFCLKLFWREMKYSVYLWSNEIICNIFEIKIIQTKFENLFQRIFFLRLKRIKNKLFFDRMENHWWCLRFNTAVSQNVIVALFVSPITCRKKIESII